MENPENIKKISINEPTGKKKKLPMIESPNIDMDYPARISSELFSYNQVRWNINVRPFRLLMMLSQTLAMEKQPYPSLFPEYSFPLKKVFTYIGTENTNRRFDLLIKDVKELMSAVIETKETTKRGKVKWNGKTLIASAEIDEENESLNIQINEKSRHYLVGMKRWAELQPNIYLNLSTYYQNWFYSYFKKEMYLCRTPGKSIKIIVMIKTLKELLKLDEVKTYDPKCNPNAQTKFLERIVGIKKPKGWVYDNVDELKNTPWDYVGTTNKETGEIKATGTLYAITTLTDINACAYAIKSTKKGTSYEKICFILSPKQSYLINNKTSQNKDQKLRSKRCKSNKPDVLMQDLFDNPPIFEESPNPLYDENLPLADSVIFPPETLDRYMEEYKSGYPGDASEINITKEELAKKMGYEILEDGRLIKYYTRKK